ncbi:MAG: pyridoxine 5'-phosphate synthase [Oligoflexia bacterium]|nr:pyridoxine 5'-phosphate synthase [Bdellovibrionales bacterium]MYE07751.1 pyridoxine 5'-phosphate synthase [Oligoflexia bacterium]
MTRLSVNVNKIATLRNSRGKNQPNLMEAVKKLIGFGVKGITIHPRPDGRHILYQDVRDIKQYLKVQKEVELNVEGYPSTDFLQLMEEIGPDQCTLVPDAPTTLTSNAGWRVQENKDFLHSALASLKKNNVRTSLFIDPFTLTEKELHTLSYLQPDRGELYTETYASAYFTPQKESVIRTYIEAAEKLMNQGIRVNAGHDLNLDNLAWLLKKIPQIKEVSIGHALICESLYQGMETVVHKYLAICLN